MHAAQTGVMPKTGCLICVARMQHRWRREREPEPRMHGTTLGPGNEPCRPGMILAATVLFLWPCLLNWHPYLFWDTYGYFM